MTRFTQLIILTIGLSVFGCGTRQAETVNVESKAKELISEIDSGELMGNERHGYE